MFYSPLRYPGGKNKLAKFIANICADNNIKGHYVEPYAGGASVALFLLLEGRVNEITINDIDRSVYAFWHSVLRNTNKLCDLIKNTDVNVENWDNAKTIYENKTKANLLNLGFATFFLNRTNHSGILNGGIIGGRNQNGIYKIDCRFNKVELIERIRRIAKYKKNINLEKLDAIDLIRKIQKKSENSETIFYFDPPYYLKGKSLYINYYNHNDHKEVCDLIMGIKNIHWIISYDDTPEIEEIYKWVGKPRTMKYSFYHSAHKAKEGKEILFFSKNLIIPKVKNPVKI